MNAPVLLFPDIQPLSLAELDGAREQIRADVAGFMFRISADPTCPPDEIQVQDERGRILDRQKIIPTKEVADGG